MKFVLPGVWIAGFTAATLVLFGTGAVITVDGAPPAARLKWLFGEIEEVSENRWVNIRPVTISFLRDTDFGSRVVFMPRARWWLFWRPHPVVRELEEAARRGLGARG